MTRDWNLLLDRYLAGECEPSEEASIQQELTRLGETLAVEALRSARSRALVRGYGDESEIDSQLSAGEGLSPAEVTEALARVDQRLVDAELRPAAAPRLRLRLVPTMRGSRRPTTPLRRLRAVTAAAAVLLAAGAATWLALRPSRASRTPVVASDMRELITARGQRGVFQLVDGSEVVLDVASRLRIPAGYGLSRRDVYLEGSAHFTVSHDASRPFIVHTARGITRDIGTKFTVRAYRDDAAEWVVVSEGSVAVAATANAAAERLLVAGQLAVVSPTGTIAVADSVDLQQELAWTRGELQFANVPLGAAIRRLSQWYDVDIELVDSSLAGRPVSGTYAGEPLRQVLTLVTAAVGAEFTWRGHRVVIFARTGGPRP